MFVEMIVEMRRRSCGDVSIYRGWEKGLSITATIPQHGISLQLMQLRGEEERESVFVCVYDRREKKKVACG